MAGNVLIKNANGNTVTLQNPDTNVADVVVDTSKIMQIRSTNITVNVGTGQTYTTINQALEYLSGFYPLHKTTGVTATINLKAGFVMAEQVLVSGLNLGWITIVGEDAETIITHTALTTNFNGGYPAFGVDKGGTSPVIGQLFRFNVEKVGGDKHGILTVGAGSSANVLSGKGFIGAGSVGIFALNGATINAQGANVSNAGANGVYAAYAATINASSVNASNSGTYGICASSDSTVNANNVNANNAGSFGIYAEACSIISAYGAIANNAGSIGIYANTSSIINAYNANASYAVTYGINANSGSTINAQDVNASNSGTYGIYASSGSTINAQSANARGAGNYGILAENGSIINAHGANASNAGTHGMYAAASSTINAIGAIIQNQTTGTARLRVLNGGHIVAPGINTSGGTVPVLSQTANTLTANGIIYQ